ncbi:MAG: hypothetical protein AUG51_12605 [Acidobacteria bacterium 13_1_20CM_3_53_8]|nr:MAG: hypothetical protein AUG51_12605 [Acidobacteria bacterium 13_1_20CM_3_53_8]
MRRILAIALVVFAAASLSAGQNRGSRSAQGGNVEQGIRQLENERREALLHNDAAYFERVLAEDYMGTNQAGQVSNKAQTVANTRSGNPHFDSLSYNDLNVRIYGNTAVVSGRATIKGQDNGQDISGQARFLRVYVKRQGRWQLVAFSTTRMAQQ